MDSLADRFRGLDHLPVRVKLRRAQYEQMSSGLLLKADIDGVLARCEVKQCSDQTRACFKISLAPGANSLEHIAFDALDRSGKLRTSHHINHKRFDTPMPKHHSPPISGGDRKALGKELVKSRAMARIFAERSEEKRRAGEALIREADNLACQSWNGRMWSDGGPIDPSPTIDAAINGG